MKEQIKKILEKYCGDYTGAELNTQLWDELYEKFNIVGFPINNQGRINRDGSFRICSPLQFSNGTETDFNIVETVTYGKYKNNYQFYAA